MKLTFHSQTFLKEFARYNLIAINGKKFTPGVGNKKKLPVFYWFSYCSINEAKITVGKKVQRFVHKSKLKDFQF